MAALNLLNSSYREHVMLLCSDWEEQDKVAIDTINEGLKSGQLCIYASVRNGDKLRISNLSSKITNYQQNLDAGNLLLVDFKPFYESALGDDLGIFAELNDRIQATILERIAQGKSDKVLIFADAAGTMSKTRHHEKSVNLEDWWHRMHSEWLRNSMNITLICPHPDRVLKEEDLFEIKHRLAAAHSLTIDLKERQKKQKEATPAKILVVEPEEDLQLIYRSHLESLGLQLAFADSGKACLEHAFNADDKEGGFDLIIIDTHLPDADGVELAGKIMERIPDQRVIFTTTSPREDVIEGTRSIGISAENIIVKPFRFSNLLALIKPGRTKLVSQSE